MMTRSTSIRSAEPTAPGHSCAPSKANGLLASAQRTLYLSAVLGLAFLWTTSPAIAQERSTEEDRSIQQSTDSPEAGIRLATSPGQGPLAGTPAGRGRGRGQGRGRGPDPTVRADQDVFHYLLEHHAEIRRTVSTRPNGVETLTESDNPAVAAKIQEHVEAMHARVTQGRGLRFWDDLFAAIFKNHLLIKMEVQRTDRGARVVETSSDPWGVALIQAHAAAVSGFVARGFEEAQRNHPLPAQKPGAQPAPPPATTSSAEKLHSELSFPLILSYGGVVTRPAAVEPPRAGTRAVIDLTSATLAHEVNRGLDRVARLLNLYGNAGLTIQDVKVTVVVHGEAIGSLLTDPAFASRFDSKQNPNHDLLNQLQEAGVEFLVCSQALAAKQIPAEELSPGIQLAHAAMIALINRQQDGYAYIPMP